MTEMNIPDDVRDLADEHCLGLPLETAPVAHDVACRAVVADRAQREQTIKDLRLENAALREILGNANNVWRHEFSHEVQAAADKLFRRLSWNAPEGVRAALAKARGA